MNSGFFAGINRNLCRGYIWKHIFYPSPEIGKRQDCHIGFSLIFFLQRKNRMSRGCLKKTVVRPKSGISRPATPIWKGFFDGRNNDRSSSPHPGNSAGRKKRFQTRFLNRPRNSLWMRHREKMLKIKAPVTDQVAPVIAIPNAVPAAGGCSTSSRIMEKIESPTARE